MISVLSEESGPAHGAMLGPVVSDTSFRGHLEESFSVDFGRYVVDGNWGQVLIARLCRARTAP